MAGHYLESFSDAKCLTGELLPGALSSISEEVVCCDLRDRAGQPMYFRTELGDPARWPLSLTLDQAPQKENRFIFRWVRLSPLPLKTNKTCSTIELNMVPDLLIENFKAHRFDVEFLCPLQIFEVEFNPDESRLNPLHKIFSASSIMPQQLRRSLIAGTRRAVILQQL
jgi:hypothetical protein